jgi:hypothetical protein
MNKIWNFFNKAQLLSAMPISLEDDKIIRKYKNKSIFGFSLSFLFFTIVMGIMLTNAPNVGK